MLNTEGPNPTIILIMINPTIDNSLEIITHITNSHIPTKTIQIINSTNTIALIPRKGENIENHGETKGTAAEIAHMERIRVHEKDRAITTIDSPLLHGTPKHQ